MLEVTKELCFQVFSTDFVNDKTVWIAEFIIARVRWTPTS